MSQCYCSPRSLSLLLKTQGEDGDTGSGGGQGASLRARLLVCEEPGVPKQSGVCPEPAGKADHLPEGPSGEKNTTLLIKKKKALFCI